MSLSGSKRLRTGINFNEGSWNEDECLKYLIFLDLNKSIMTSRQKKKYHFLLFPEFIESLIR